MNKKTFCVLAVASLLLLCFGCLSEAQVMRQAGQLPQPQYQQQQPAAGQQQYQQPPGMQPPGYPQPTGYMPPQPPVQPQPPAQPPQLNIPPAPPRPVPNSQYGNTDRAAIIGEQFSKSSQGNANVYVSENGNRTVSLDVYLTGSSDPYAIAGAMANLTYAVSAIYYFTDMAGSDILLTVRDTSGNVVTRAKFSDAKNAFEYYDVPEAARAAPQQPGYAQPQQPSYAQPSAGQQPAAQPPYFGGGQGQF